MLLMNSISDLCLDEIVATCQSYRIERKYAIPFRFVVVSFFYVATADEDEFFFF